MTSASRTTTSNILPPHHTTPYHTIPHHTIPHHTIPTVTCRYGKALDRRAKLHRRLATSLGGGDEALQGRIVHLRQAMEDVSMVAQIDGFKHEQLMFVDEVLKLLGSALARQQGKSRLAVLPSSHTIQQ